ncbi:hypothetical protein ACHRV6_22500 [Flavobacterium sp. FlaQc-51]
MEKLILEVSNEIGLKDLYEINETPPLGHTPALMHAYVMDVLT